LKKQNKKRTKKSNLYLHTLLHKRGIKDLEDRNNGIVPQEYSDLREGLQRLLQSREGLVHNDTRNEYQAGDPLEQARPFIKAPSHLWDFGKLIVISAQNLDYGSPEELEGKFANAINEVWRSAKKSKTSIKRQ